MIIGWSIIGWSKAPEGYPIWIESKDGIGSGWHRDDGAYYVDEKGKFWMKNHGHLYDVHFMKEWTGEGLPPVGTVCEWFDKNTAQRWITIKVVYQSSWVVVVQEMNPKNPEDPVDIGLEIDKDNPQFRPIRTAEQIAADEREAKAKAMYLSIYFAEPPESWDRGPDTRRETFRKAIDAGW